MGVSGLKRGHGVPFLMLRTWFYKIPMSFIPVYVVWRSVLIEWDLAR